MAGICSTHVEMFLHTQETSRSSSDLLHACGDVSIYKIFDSVADESAPRMWRCFWKERTARAGQRICSTHVEMFPSSNKYVMPRPNLLHACGDVSFSRFRHGILQGSAPRMWRCFLRLVHGAEALGICSTHVEMFLSVVPLPPKRSNLLHACGDVSLEQRQRHRGGRSAPRMWRCFLYMQRGDGW